MQRRPFRAALVGAGRMGVRHGRVLAAMPDLFTVSAVVDPDDERARALAAATGASVVASVAQAARQADVVVVATPPAAHEAVALAALAAGKAVFVEKPLAPSPDAAARLVDAALAAGVPLFVGHSERFNPVVTHLRRTVRPEAIRGLALRRVGDASRAPACSDVLLDLGVHDLDLAAHLLGSSLDLVASARTAADAFSLRLTTTAGVVAHVQTQRRGAEPLRELALRTAAGIYQGDLLHHRLHLVDAEGHSRPMLLALDEPLRLQARELHRCLSTRSSSLTALSPLATGHDGARVVELVALAEKLSAPSPLWYPGRHHVSVGR